MSQRTGFLLLPMPGHSLLLFVSWLALNNTVAPGHLVLGALLAFFIPLVVKGFRTSHPPVRKYGLAIRYFLMVLGDIVVANIEVAMKVIGPVKKLQPAFVAVPLEFDNELLITILSSTVSLTPGTVSAEVSRDRRWLYVHVLHLEDEQKLIEQIKQRYEARLREIFGC